MSSDSKEKEKIDSAGYLSVKDNDIEELKRKLDLPRVTFPMISFGTERGFFGYIALGVLSGLLVRRVEFYMSIFDFNFLKRAAKKFPGSFMSVMTQREAKLILNLPENANAKQIRQAHIKLMLLNHPDSGGSTYLASKINEAKDLLSSEVEDEKKEATDMQEDEDSSLNDILQDVPGEKESERFLLSILYGHKEIYTKKEIAELKKKLDEILIREKAEEKVNSKHSQYEYKEFKIEDSPLNEEPGRFVDKNSEFYQKYKDKIERGDYLDPYDDINTKRSRLTNKNDAFKI